MFVISLSKTSRIATYSISFILILSSLACAQDKGSVPVTIDQPRNVIFLIGDGMGLSQVSTLFFYGEERNAFERFEHVSLIKTSSAKQKITDSAAGATAFSSGVKTYNGAIGLDQDSLSVETLFEFIKPKGFKTGLIATSAITHATPAAFYSHVKSRKQYEDIAVQLVNNPPDFFAGGGLQFFNKRSDNVELLKKLNKAGVKVNTHSLPDINDVQFNTSNKYGYLLADDGMPKANDRGGFLPEVSALALNYFSGAETGFFLMIEGSQIDWAGHANDAEYLMAEMTDFNKTLNKVLDFAEKDGNTLVVVTADHETGGYTLASEKGDYDKIRPSFSTGGHSATLIPVFSFGKGAENFKGIYENTDLNVRLKRLLK